MRIMDIIVNTNLNKIKEIIEKLNFKITKINNKILNAKYKCKHGKYHICGIKLNEKQIYLDIHWDYILHFTFIGVDYKNKPKTIVNKIIKILNENKIKYKLIEGFSWRNRLNKAIIKGIKIKGIKFKLISS